MLHLDSGSRETQLVFYYHAIYLPAFTYIHFFSICPMFKTAPKIKSPSENPKYTENILINSTSMTLPTVMTLRSHPHTGHMRVPKQKAHREWQLSIKVLSYVQHLSDLHMVIMFTTYFNWSVILIGSETVRKTNNSCVSHALPPLPVLLVLCAAWSHLGRHVQLKCMELKSPIIIPSHKVLYTCTSSRKGDLMLYIWKAVTMQSALAARKSIPVSPVFPVHSSWDHNLSLSIRSTFSLIC